MDPLELEVPSLDLHAPAFFDLEEPHDFQFELVPQDFIASSEIGHVERSDDTLFDSPSASPLRADPSTPSFAADEVPTLPDDDIVMSEASPSYLDDGKDEPMPLD